MDTTTQRHSRSNKSDAIAKVPLLLFCVLVLGCDVSEQAERPARCVESTPRHSCDDINLGLAETIAIKGSLGNRYPIVSGRNPAERKKDLQRCLKPGVLDERDQTISNLNRAISALPRPSALRCLVLERLDIGDGGGPGRYERLILYSMQNTSGDEWESVALPDGRHEITLRQAKEAEAIRPLGATQVDRRRWSVIESLIGEVLKDGPSNNGITMISANVDLILVSYFDGKHWRIVQLYNFSELMSEAPPETGLQGTCLFCMLHVVNTALGPSVRFAEERYIHYLDQLKR